MMRCPRCGHNNPSQPKFCLECGAHRTLTCAKCRAELPPSAKFCPECGERVTPATDEATRFASSHSYTPQHLAERILTSKTALEGERKQATVLFADLNGSMIAPSVGS
jgi:predicted amidophosphoribosyltransferase